MAARHMVKGFGWLMPAQALERVMQLAGGLAPSAVKMSLTFDPLSIAQLGNPLTVWMSDVDSSLMHAEY
jgi:hypothetical protein